MSFERLNQRSPSMVDALFVLACGCIMDGCSDSHPGRAWQEGVRNGFLQCPTHWRPEILVDVVTL